MKAFLNLALGAEESAQPSGNGQFDGLDLRLAILESD
jgi:hypothetical protein